MVLAAARQRQAVELARENIPAARRLSQAYQGALPGIQAAIEAALQTGANPYQLGELVQAIAVELKPLEDAIAIEAMGLQFEGAEAGVRVGIRNLVNGGLNAQWNRVTADAIIEGIRIVDGEAFRARLAMLGEYHGQQIADVIVTGIAQGRNPREIAVIIQQYLTGSQKPMQDALRMARTTQIYAMRQGTRSIYERAGVSEWIWSSALDDRTCIACLCMHGTVHPVSEALNDHHAGRCAMVPVTPRWADLGFDDGGEPTYQTGVDWFEALDDAGKAQVLGPQLFEAWQGGAFEFTPEVIVGTYQNDIFGEMRRARTNAEILGN